MNEYHLDVRTDEDLGSEAFVRGLLGRWCNHPDEKLRPEFFDLGEPIRRRFDAEGVEAAVRTWVESGMSLMLKRKKPRFVISIDWRRNKGLDARLFPWSCTVWLSFSAGDQRAGDLLRFLVANFKPSFGHASTYFAHRAKHFVTYRDPTGEAQRYLGLDVGKTLPGIYWITYFGPWAVQKVGRSRLESLRAHKIERVDGGYLVDAYASAKDAGTPAARDAEAQIITHLGKEHFFDKATVDIEALKTDAATAALVEAKIEEVKAKRSKKR